MARRAIGQQRTSRPYRLAEQILHHGQQRGQAQLGIEQTKRGIVAIVGCAQAHLVADLLQLQTEIAAELCGVGDGQAQRLAEIAAGQQGIAEYALGRDMHALAQQQAQQRVGTEARASASTRSFRA